MLGLEVQMYKRCDQLSGGQKQWIGIARALVQQPRMLLCDESIASLDPSSAKIIIDTLREINRTWGITVLVNLDQVDVALHYAERIIGINRGKILYDGGPQALSNAQIYQIYGLEAGELILDRSYAVEIWVERGWASEARIGSRTMAAVLPMLPRPFVARQRPVSPPTQWLLWPHTTTGPDAGGACPDGGRHGAPRRYDSAGHQRSGARLARCRSTV